MRKLNFKKRLSSIAVLPAVAIILAGSAYAAATFGPSRPTYTWAHPADHITFNSITDNPDPSIGDERYFISARDNASSNTLTYHKSLNVTDNEEVLIRIFFHNDAAANLNLVAHNVKAKASLPSTPDTSIVLAAHISASNATPGDVWSTMNMSGARPFTINYEPGTAKITTQYMSGVPISDSIVTTGATIGAQAVNGDVPGCSQFSGFVGFKVRVHMASVPTPPPTPTPQPQPQPQPAKALPNTGAGDVLGAFAGVSAAGTAVHYAVTRRRK